MKFFNEIHEKIKNGDKLLTRSHLGRTDRVVTYNDNCVSLMGYTYPWDYFLKLMMQ